ncbi:MAG: hypothetical protein RLZZ244_727, partial [Verrucomicrobiota bacterium]
MNLTTRALSALGISLLSLLFPPLPGSLHGASAQVFNSNPPVNDLKGSLEAQVLFAQSQIIPARPREGDTHPHLTSLRKTLLLVRPCRASDAPLSVSILGPDGRTLGSLPLDPPKLLPRTAYWREEAPEPPLDFSPGKGSTGEVKSQALLEKLSDPRGLWLESELRRHALVRIETANGQWVRQIHLPPARALHAKVVHIHSEAGYASTILYSGREATLSQGQSLRFKCFNGVWFHEEELINQSLTYASDAWSGILPAEWILPGLRLVVHQGERSGELAPPLIGAPTELLIHTIDIGMLASPRGEFAFATDPQAHREYFQTVPVSRLIVSSYAPLELREVMLPSGTLLTGEDPSEGGWHTGMMRQSIGKELISHGIDNANYGIHSTAGQGENSHPYLVAQLTAHNSRGKYSNGLQKHGGSGGGGIVTLDQSVGNEFSHEVGHNYGLGHFVDGFKGSVHRSANHPNSTWGWDADKNRFLPNFTPHRTGKPTSLDGQSQDPFEGRSFGLDAMAGGAPFSGFNRFTLYTPNSAAIIQRFLESKAVFDSSSPTGFRTWNPHSSRMEPFSPSIPNRTEAKASIPDLSGDRLAALLAQNDHVTLALSDGHWTRQIPLPPASLANQGRRITVQHEASYESVLPLNGQPVKLMRGFLKHYRSDGARWMEEEGTPAAQNRKPR